MPRRPPEVSGARAQHTARPALPAPVASGPLNIDTPVLQPARGDALILRKQGDLMRGARAYRLMVVSLWMGALGWRGLASAAEPAPRALAYSSGSLAAQGGLVRSLHATASFSASPPRPQPAEPPEEEI